MVRIVIAVLSISIIFTIPGLAENPNPSVLMLDFSQNNNTYNWENNYSKHFDFQRMQCDLNINASSLLLKKPYKRWQEQLSATFNAEYRIIDGFSAAPYINHTRNALQDRKVYTAEIKLALPFKKLRYADFTPFIANRSINRLGDSPEGEDRGMGMGISGVTKKIKVLGNNMNSRASYEHYDLNNIPFSEFNFGFDGSRVFNTNDSLTWRIEDVESITRYYDRLSSSTNGIDSILVVRQVKIDRRAEGLAKITLPYELIFRAAGDISTLKYIYNRGGNTSTLTKADNYNQGRNYDVNFEKTFIDMFDLQGGYKYSRGEADYRSSVLDQWNEGGEISFGLIAGLSPTDTVFFDGILGVTSYFGLHGEKQNDRDVKTQIYNGRIKRIFSDYFNSEIRGAYSSFHQKYISGLNSASNNRNDTYLLQASMEYRPYSRLGINQVFTIQANYIIYDYDPNPLETNNRIFRRASTETKLTIALSENLDFMPSYAYRYEDYGKLIYDDDNWQMATGWDRRYHYAHLKIDYRPIQELQLEPEYGWELKREYNHVLEQADSLIEEDYIVREQRLHDTKNIIALRVVWQMSPNEYIDFKYSRREWEVKDRDKDITEFFNVSVRYMF